MKRASEAEEGKDVKRSILERWPLLFWTLLCGMLWGSAFPAIKLVFEHWEAQGLTIDFGTRSFFSGVRFIAAGGVLLLLSRAPWAEWRATPKRWIWAMTGTQTVGQYVCFYLGLSLASGALASLLISSGSFWWMLLAPWCLGTPKPSGRQWLILLMGAVGVSLAVYAPGVETGNPRLGGLLILLASLFGALGLVCFRFVQPTMGARAGTGFSLFLGGWVLLFLGGPVIAEAGALFDGYTLALTAWLAFVSAAAFALWNQLSILYPVHLLATYRFLIPLCALVESLIFLEGERLTVPMAVGGLLVFSAMILAQRAGRPVAPIGAPEARG